jgi:glycosyltransferase involved in cell wall biosynthesis
VAGSVSAAVSARPPRVWLACDWFVKYTAGLAGGLEEAGCEALLLTRDHDREFGDCAGAMEGFVAEALGGSGRHFVLPGRVRDPAGILDVLRLRREAGRWRPDFVHVQDSLANDARLGVASRLRGGRYALTVHDPVPHPGDAVQGRWQRAARLRLRRGAGLVFVHSEALAEELRATGEVAAPIAVVPHGAGVPEPAPLPERPSLLFFGRMSYYKGLDVLLDAMPSVWERHPEVTLVIAGDGEIPTHPALADPRVAVNQRYLPESELPGLFAASTCVVLPYRQASQSGVGTLAKQHGRAVVATRVGGLAELVGPDEGRLVEPGDRAALAAAVEEIVADPPLAAALGRRAAASSAGASWRSVGEATLAAYRRHLS